MTSVPNKEFEVAYRLDCRNLCADFQEDIEFRFSLGITSLMYRYLGAKGTRQALTGYDAVSFSHRWYFRNPSKSLRVNVCLFLLLVPDSISSV